METSSLFELLRLAAAALAMLGDTTKPKRAFVAVQAEWKAGKQGWRSVLIDIAIIALSLGAPLHYGLQLAQDITAWG